ncbi:MAG: pseudouridine synthase [Clostridia bacterium]
MRINKFLSECGLGSRRKCEEIVTAGRVKINGRAITSLASVVNEKNDTVAVDGHNVKLDENKVYIKLYKPKGFITTTSDEKGRKTVMDLLPENYKTCFPVGRLDYDTEGLLIMTNDGDIAYKLTHPSCDIEKVYVVVVEGTVVESELAVLRAGIVVNGVRADKARVKLLEASDTDGTSRLEVVISEGKNRQVRHMMEAIGKKVTFLKRVQIGKIRLGGLSRGGYRLLTSDELNFISTL